MLENLYYYEKLMEFQQRDEMKKSREIWRHSSSLKQRSGSRTKAFEMINHGKNNSCVECCC